MVNNYSEKEKEIIKDYESKYPNKTARDLKIEIEKISDMLLGDEESNRYTYQVRKKAVSDRHLDKIRKVIPDSVSFLDFKNNKLKAQVNYIENNNEFTIIMHMNVVAKGRVFLKKYKTMKRRLLKEGV